MRGGWRDHDSQEPGEEGGSFSKGARMKGLMLEASLLALGTSQGRGVGGFIGKGRRTVQDF